MAIQARLLGCATSGLPRHQEDQKEGGREVGAAGRRELAHSAAGFPVPGRGGVRCDKQAAGGELATGMASERAAGTEGGAGELSASAARVRVTGAEGGATSGWWMR